MTVFKGQIFDGKGEADPEDRAAKVYTQGEAERDGYDYRSCSG